MSTNLMRFIGALIGVAMWFTLVLMKLTGVEPFVIFLTTAIAGVMGHGVGVWQSTDSPPPDKTAAGTKLYWANPPPNLPVPPVEANQYGGKQGGFISLKTLFTLIFLAVVLAVACAGCAAVPQPVVDAKKVSDDNAVTNLKLGICNLPLGAILRHPEIQSFAVETCRP